MPALSQRRALGALFAVLAVAFGGIALAAGNAGVWVVAVAAVAIAIWLAGMAWRALGRR